jgi:DNA-binding HxlR family transcriptional regulator
MSTPRRDPTTLAGRPCSIAAALDLVGERWSLLAVREVMLGNHQFSQIARNTGAPRDRLAARLKALVEAGVLERRPKQEGSQFGDGYHLTEAGRALGPTLRALREWGDTWAVTAPPLTVLHHDHPLTSTACDTCGERIEEADLSRVVTVADWTLTGRVLKR